MPPRRPPRRPPPERPPRREPQWGDDGNGWWATASKPIAVVGGLQARSQRGAIGDTWWSQRFITLLEMVGIGGRLQRGKRYARTGQVISMQVKPGKVTASVQGSRATPYKVSIATKVLSAAEWRAAEDVMAQSAVFMAKLLAGDMPEEIEEAFVGSSGPLLPRSARDFESGCSCPDWENPCKHIAAVYFLLAEDFDRDPFLIFSWRGRDKETLLTNLRKRRRGSASADRRKPVGPSEARESSATTGAGDFGWPVSDPDANPAGRHSDVESIWGRESDLADLLALPVRPRLAVAPDLLLRQLDPESLGGSAQRIQEVLRPMYEAMTAGSAATTIGAEEPQPGTSRSPED